jgi:ABC-type multidrug transport system fused ATPase/permease subunit
MLQVRAKTIGVRISELSIKSNEKILEVLKSYRETVVRNRGSYYAEEIRKLRYSLASVTAEQNFQPYISKYVFELMTVLGGLSLTAYEFGTKNSVYAVSILTLFIAASSRITPAALRIQQGFLAVRNNVGVSESTFKIIKDLENANLESLITVEPNFVYDDFLPRIELSGLKFKYNTAGRFALDITNLKIEPGTRVAVVGPSGAGKTTFVDILLGVLRPQEGHVLISGETPVEASRKWSGAISYVPQEIFISSGSIRENISLGFGPKTATDERVWAALDVALLAEFAKSYPDEIDSLIGEEGANISGGQRQRLGIARALFTSPKLLVLDESTSSLDGQTEAGINRAISNLSRDVTVVIVAHRLSTVMNADQVIYMNQGKILAIGKFEEVRKAVVDFDQQATLMGL